MKQVLSIRIGKSAESVRSDRFVPRERNMISILRPGATEKVVVMDNFRSGKTLSPIRQAEAYWTALRNGGDIPLRSQVDPRGLEQILNYAFVLERVAPGIARFRLAGQHLCDLAGMEVKGIPITAFFTPAARGKVSATLEHVFDRPAIAQLTLSGEKQSLRGDCEARMLLLPLKSDLGEISRILGVMIADGEFGRQPRRFNVTGSEFRDLSVSPVSVKPEVEPVQGFAEAQTVLGGRAPHLRLVKTDD